METKANYVLIGAFTLIVTLLLLLFALWAAKYSSEKDWRTYAVVFNEPVTGLSEGSSVQYNGISVGTVQTLRVRSVQATYGLGLLRGDPAALRSLTLDGLSATIDLRHRRSDAPSALAGVLELLPRPLPAVTCTGEVRLLLPDHEVHLSHLRLDAARVLYLPFSDHFPIAARFHATV